MRDHLTEPHIRINDDRNIVVPKELRKIAVQFDHNVETVTFDCPRYWDGVDMSKMTVYINYMRKDGARGQFLAKNVVVDTVDDKLMHFDWKLSQNATLVKGALIFLVCIKQTGDSAEELFHWNSERCGDLTVSEGLECEDVVGTLHADIITDLLVRMDKMLAANTPVLDQTLTLHGMAADAKKTGEAISELRSETTEAIGSLQKDVNSKTADISERLTTTTDDLADALREESAQRAADISKERKRIDALAKLKAGSTTGDAELIDARIAFNGMEHDSAGAAVRSQIELAHEHICSVARPNIHNLFDPLYAIDDTGYTTGTGEHVHTTEYWITSKMSVVGLTSIYCNRRVYKYACYDADGNYMPDASATTDSANLDPILIANGVAYIGLQFMTATIPFSERFDIVCCDAEHAYIEGERKYRIDPDKIDGTLRVVPGILEEDARNLFDPLKASDNLAFATVSGIAHTNASFWSTHFIDASACDYVVTDRQPYKYAWYDENLAFVSSVRDAVSVVSYIQKFIRPENAKYLRIMYHKDTVPFEDRFDIVITSNHDLFSTVRPRYNLGKPDYSAFLNMLSVDSANVFDPIQARNNTCFETVSGGMFTNKLYWVTDYISINGVTNFKVNKTVYKHAWYDASKNCLSVNGSAPEGAEFVVFQFAQSVVSFADRFSVIICDATKEISTVKPHYYYQLETPKNEFKLLGGHQFRFPLTSATYMSDHTFIKGKLYVVNASNDAHTDTNNVTVYTVDHENGTAKFEKIFKHNLGHCNSIDYCAGNDCLIMGNGSGDTTLPGEIYILPNPAERDSWRYEDCIKINVSGENWGFKTNVVWGEHNNSQYNIAYVITNNNANVRKLLLTKKDGVFTGSYILLDSWETKVIDVNQGSVYRNGKLYMAIGHSQVWVLEYTLKPGGIIEVQEYKDIFYDENGAVLNSPFVEGITIENGYMYVGTWDGYIQVYKNWG